MVSVRFLYLLVGWFVTNTFFFSYAHGQINVQGIVVDKESGEAISFVFIRIKSGGGGVSDDDGFFHFELDKLNANDSVIITNVGYQPLALSLEWLASHKDTVSISLRATPQTEKDATVVHTKYDRNLWFWKKVMKQKNKYDEQQKTNYSCEIYSKLELDINHVNKAMIHKFVAFKSFRDVLEAHLDSAEHATFLPVYLVESLSDFYAQKKPERKREIVKAYKVMGVENESLISQIGGMNFNVNPYNNTILVFNQEFVSPFATNADWFYKFRLLDTQYLGNHKLIHLAFYPKRKAENVFVGDCWIVDTALAIQKITLRLPKVTNISLVNSLTLIKEYSLVNDSTWFVSKDKFVVDVSFIGTNTFGLLGKKTATYQNIHIADTSVARMIEAAKLDNQVDIIPQTIAMKSDSFWNANRHTPLNKTERSVYEMIDTLDTKPAFVFYKNFLTILFSGKKQIGPVVIGPWFDWVSWNQYQGVRSRFDVATHRDGFSKKWYLHGYLAYGFGNHTLFGGGDVKYQFNRKPWTYLSLSYVHDLDFGNNYYDAVGSDNLFGTTLHRKDIPYKFQVVETTKLDYQKSTNKGFSINLTAERKLYTPVLNLPAATSGSSFNSFETGIAIRYAHAEKFIENNFSYVSLGSDRPIISVSFLAGIPNILGSQYHYQKLAVSVRNSNYITPFGKIYYNVFAGEIFGTVPYPLLNILPGNEMYYSSKYAFNLLNRYEFVGDRYAGFNIENNLGGFLFNYIPITRKLKWRQFWTLKGIWSTLSKNNEALTTPDPITNTLYSLHGNMYYEIGTGIDNIFEYFRLDCIWRLVNKNAQEVYRNNRNFGVFVSARISF